MERKPCPDGTEALPRWNGGREPPKPPAAKGLPALAASGRRRPEGTREPPPTEAAAIAAAAGRVAAGSGSRGGGTNRGRSGSGAGLEWNPGRAGVESGGLGLLAAGGGRAWPAYQRPAGAKRTPIAPGDPEGRPPKKGISHVLQ